MLDKIHWLGHDSFRIDGEKTIYIDPWQLSADQPIADLILVTHDHFDHCSPEDIATLCDEDTIVVANESAAELLGGKVAGEVRAVEPGDRLMAAGIDIETLPAYNTNKFREPGTPFHPKEAKHVGYIINVGNQRIYHCGDADDIPEMESLEVDIAMIPVSGTYVMTAEEAVKAAGKIKPNLVIPMHYGTIVGDRGDAEKFAEQYSGETVIMEKE